MRPQSSPALQFLVPLLCIGGIAAALPPPAARADEEPARPAAAKAKEAQAETYQQLQREFDQQRQKFSEAYQAAKTPEERQKVMEAQYPRPEKYAHKFLAVAEKTLKDSAALDPLVWIVTNARGAPEHRTAVGHLVEHHLASERMGDVAQSLAYMSDAPSMDALRTLREKSPHRDVKGKATFTYAMNLQRGEKGSPEAEKLFEEVVEKYADVPGWRGTLGESAKGYLFEARNLSIGKVAPEIEGEDVDGKKFKLSEYRGKVVVLDFWGDW